MFIISGQEPERHGHTCFFAFFLTYTLELPIQFGLSMLDLTKAIESNADLAFPFEATLAVDGTRTAQILVLTHYRLAALMALEQHKFGGSRCCWTGAKVTYQDLSDTKIMCTSAGPEVHLAGERLQKPDKSEHIPGPISNSDDEDVMFFRAAAQSVKAGEGQSQRPQAREHRALGHVRGMAKRKDPGDHEGSELDPDDIDGEDSDEAFANVPKQVKRPLKDPAKAKSSSASSSSSSSSSSARPAFMPTVTKTQSGAEFRCDGKLWGRTRSFVNQKGILQTFVTCGFHGCSLFYAGANFPGDEAVTQWLVAGQGLSQAAHKAKPKPSIQHAA